MRARPAPRPQRRRRRRSPQPHVRPRSSARLPTSPSPRRAPRGLPRAAGRARPSTRRPARRARPSRPRSRREDRRRRRRTPRRIRVEPLCQLASRVGDLAGDRLRELGTQLGRKPVDPPSSVCTSAAERSSTRVPSRPRPSAKRPSTPARCSAASSRSVARSCSLRSSIAVNTVSTRVVNSAPWRSSRSIPSDISLNPSTSRASRLSSICLRTFFSRSLTSSLSLSRSARVVSFDTGRGRRDGPRFHPRARPGPRRPGREIGRQPLVRRTAGRRDGIAEPRVGGVEADSISSRRSARVTSAALASSVIASSTVAARRSPSVARATSISPLSAFEARATRSSARSATRSWAFARALSRRRSSPAPSSLTRLPRRRRARPRAAGRRLARLSRSRSTWARISPSERADSARISAVARSSWSESAGGTARRSRRADAASRCSGLGMRLQPRELERHSLLGDPPGPRASSRTSLDSR